VKRWVPWLLSAFMVLHGADLLLPVHDESLEQLGSETGQTFPEQPPLHSDHTFCNHSCHSAAHATALTAVPWDLPLARPRRTELVYATDAIPREPDAPPTPKPKPL